MQCKRREMARFDLSGRWRSCQGVMVLSAGLANPWVPPHARPQTLPANASHAGQASTGRMIKTGGPQWLELDMGACHSIVDGRLKKTLSGRVSDSSNPAKGVSLSNCSRCPGKNGRAFLSCRLSISSVDSGREGHRGKGRHPSWLDMQTVSLPVWPDGC